MTAPVADCFVGRIFQCHVAGSDRDYGSSQHLHFFDIDVLALNVRFTHIDDTFHIHQSTYGSCCNAVLSGSCFGDDTFLAHAACQQNLSDSIIDFVGTCMVQVFPFQIHFATILF